MPFELETAPSTFQRVMDIFLSGVKWKFVLVYLEGSVTFLTSVEKHLHHWRTVLGLPSRADVSKKLEKCFFFDYCISSSISVIQTGRPGISTKVTDAISGLQHHTNVTEHKAFLGLCNVFRRFVTNLASIATSLSPKLEMDQTFDFGRLSETEIEALETLQRPPLSPYISEGPAKP